MKDYTINCLDQRSHSAVDGSHWCGASQLQMLLYEGCLEAALCTQMSCNTASGYCDMRTHWMCFVKVATAVMLL